MLRAAAAGAGMTRDQLAAKANFSRAKTQSILGGQVMPSMDDLTHLSEALRLSKLRVLASAGYLDGIDNLITYLDQLEDQAERIDVAASQLVSSPMSGPASIAGAALTSGDFEVVMKPLWLGTGDRRRHYSDRVILSRRKGGDFSEADRRRVELLLRQELAWFGAGFIDGWEGGPSQLAINVPRFVALRHSNGSPTQGHPRSIVVIGGHWAGSADVASFLGYAFDYDYSHVSFAASRAFSRLTHDWSNEYRERDRLEVTRTYTEGSAIGRHRVWAADVGDSEEAVKIIATSRRRETPFVISLRPSDDVLEWTAHVRSQWNHTYDDPKTGLRKLRAARDRVDQVLSPLSEKSQVLDIPLPGANSVDRSGNLHHEPDAWFDMWADKAEQVIEKLRSPKHGFHFDKAAALRQMRNGGRSPRAQ